MYLKEIMSNGDIIDLGDVKQFKLPKIKKYFENYDKVIRKERLIKANLNKLAETRIKYGKDFLITNHISVDKNGNKTDDGIFSAKFGFSQFDDQTGSRDSYRCHCGALTGAIYLDEICDECKTKVAFMDADLSIMGWVPLNKYVVINPSMFIHLEILIGKEELHNILHINSSRMDVNGILQKEQSADKPFHNIGMMNFYKNIDSILKYYADKNSNHYDHYELLSECKDSIFTHYIPVYSAIIRPRIEANEKIRSFQANKIYDTIMNQYNLINTEVGNMFTILPALYEIQIEFNELYDIIIQSYAGKEGLFRANFGGIRIDYGARSVIVNGKYLKPDEVDIPYISAITFLELELIYLLKILDNITENEAYTIINQALRTFNSRIYSLAQTICDKSKNGIHILLGRPPTLSDRSIRLLRIKNIKKDINDLTIAISPPLLDGMAGDFDGDSLYYLPIRDYRLVKTFEQTLSPRYNYISRTDGKYSSRMTYIKDYIIVLSELYELSK